MKCLVLINILLARLLMQLAPDIEARHQRELEDDEVGTARTGTHLGQQLYSLCYVNPSNAEATFAQSIRTKRFF